MGTLEMLVVRPLYWPKALTHLTRGATQAVRVGKDLRSALRKVSGVSGEVQLLVGSGMHPNHQ